MATITKDERFAILLKSLGSEFSESVLKQVEGAQAKTMKSAMNRLELKPLDDDEVTEVLDEFDRFMEFAMSNSSELIATDERAASQEHSAPDFESTGDPFDDLDKLEDFQIAGALRHETGVTISLILGQLSDARVGAIMKQLPDEVQEEAFLRLQSSPQIARPLLGRIVQSIVVKASLLDQTATSDPVDLADEKTASLLRAMDRKTRTTMMAALEASNPEVAERVKAMLFIFEDLLRFTDKSVQRLLTEVDTAELATALKNADEDITERITTNLSKRARATLLEEIEYLDAVSSEQEEQAQKAVANIFSQLDQRGDLEMIE